MEKDEYARIAAAEDSHWWYRSMRGLMADLLSPWLGTDQTILDAGCGPGGNGAWLARHGDVVGVDLASEALQFVHERRPEIAAVQANVTELPFADAAFDLVVEITVAFCIPDDALAIGELSRVLRPGGAVALVEPAFPSLRRAHDKTVHAVRRYRLRDLAALAEAAGLRVERATYAYSFLAPPALGLALADRVLDRPAAETGSDVEKRWLDRAFGPLATAERRWLARHTIPFGTSALVMATRPA